MEPDLAVPPGHTMSAWIAESLGEAKTRNVRRASVR